MMGQPIRTSHEGGVKIFRSSNSSALDYNYNVLTLSENQNQRLVVLIPTEETNTAHGVSFAGQSGSGDSTGRSVQQRRPARAPLGGLRRARGTQVALPTCSGPRRAPVVCSQAQSALNLTIVTNLPSAGRVGESGRVRPSNTNLFSLGSLRKGRREEIGHLADAGRNETAFWPDEAYVADTAHKFLQDSHDIRMAELISKGNLGEQADSNPGQHGGPDRFDTVG